MAGLVPSSKQKRGFVELDLCESPWCVSDAGEQEQVKIDCPGCA